VPKLQNNYMNYPMPTFISHYSENIYIFKATDKRLESGRLAGWLSYCLSDCLSDCFCSSSHGISSIIDDSAKYLDSKYNIDGANPHTHTNAYKRTYRHAHTNKETHIRTHAHTRARTHTERDFTCN